MLATYVPVYFILAQTIHLNYWNMIQNAVKCVKKILLMLTYCIWSKRCCCWQLVACISSSPAAYFLQKVLRNGKEEVYLKWMANLPVLLSELSRQATAISRVLQDNDNADSRR